jgi:hypothetical protein
MQDRFAGDIGDFGKYGLLRALARPPLSLGILWYLTPDGESGGDRRKYLKDPARFRPCDPSLFDALTAFHGGERRVSRILLYPILPSGTLSVQDPVPAAPLREGWFSTALSITRPCDLVFLDPDNGIAPRSIPRSRSASGHYVYPEEIEAFHSREQSVLIYHHLSRREPVAHQIQKRLLQLGRTSIAFRFHRGGSRAFFLLPSSVHQDLLEERIGAFLKTPWREHFTLYPRGRMNSVGDGN